MKFNYLTTIGLTVVGVVLGFLITNLIVQNMGLEDFSFPAIDESASSDAKSSGYNYADVTQPNNEILNYNALNPTVEAYVGECAAYDKDGNCQDTIDEEEANEQNNGEVPDNREELEEGSNTGAEDQENS